MAIAAPYALIRDVKNEKVADDDLPPPNVAEEQKHKLLPTWVRERDPRDLLYASVVMFVHVLCLFAPFTFTWARLQLALIRYLTSGLLGITLCYHRQLSHGSFRLPKSLEYLFATLGFHALQGDPIFWVSAHRYHHKFTDTNRDPHSPIEGFWFSHIYWIFDKNYLTRKLGVGLTPGMVAIIGMGVGEASKGMGDRSVIDRVIDRAGNSGNNFTNVNDLMSQRYYRFLQTTRVPHVGLLVVILYMLGGFPFVVWGIGVANTWGYHVTFCVNSVCHTWGNQAWNTKDLSKNNWVVALLTFGEGWHNNHHAFEFSAQQGLEWWQIDPTWYVIKLLKFAGLATNVKVPSKFQKEKMAFNKYSK